jgi:hypothetical protein
MTSVNNDFQCSIENIYAEKTAEVIKQVAAQISEKRISKLSVSTMPSGACVILNNKIVGVTPYLNEKLQSGAYSLKIELSTYETIQKPLDLKRGLMEDMQFTLTHTQQYNDSLRRIDSLNTVKVILAKTYKENKRKRVKLVSRVTAGILSAGMVAGGYYMDTKIKDVMTEKQQIYNNYLTSTNTADIKRYQSEYDQEHKNGEKLSTQRNLLYLGSGLSAVFFGITFLF